VVRVEAALSLLSRGVPKAWAILAAIGSLVMVVAVGLADAWPYRSSGPWASCTRVTCRLQRGETEARGSPAGPPEMAEVGVAVKRLADRIGDLLAAER